ncbi:MAG: methylmalonyl-CoA mutase small subunit [Prolixibacteraceae bacterium]|nr:methylmalonyl-CoA mutase small subunit [Prolixibacteraceae bacterium]
MAEKKTKFFDEFPPVSTEAWQNKITADLKGADFEKKLVWRTNEGFNVQPYYRQEDLERVKYLDTLPGNYPFVRGSKTNNNNWFIRQDIKVASLEDANKKALEILNKGVNSLGFILDDGTKLTPRDITVLFKDIRLDSIDTALVYNNIDAAIIFANYISENYKNSNISASVNINPLDTLTLKGYLSNTDLNGLKPLMEKTAALKKFRTTAITGKNFRDAGSNIVQELAFSLAMGAEYLTKLTDEGLDALTAASKLKFNMGVGTNYFMEIAKLRALRLLWAKLTEAYGVDISKCNMFIHSENTIWNKTFYDPYVNMLRTQTEAMSAVLGGTDSLTVMPFNAIFEESTPFAERIARNQQILLKEESHFDKIADPAAGSYYIENLTDSIAEETWKLFLEIQDKGGYIEAFKSGFIQQSIEETAGKMDQAIATRRENLLGTNQFPNFSEYAEREFSAEIFCKKSLKCDQAIAEPVKTYRGAQAFEKLRYKTDLFSKDNKRPLTFMLTIGKLNMRKARAQFAANFFAIAGFDVKEGKGYETIEEGVADAKKAGADIVVICSSDDEYAAIAPAAKELLNDKIFVVAGNPSCKPDLEAKGINNFIHVRSNLLEELKAYQKQLIK